MKVRLKSLVAVAATIALTGAGVAFTATSASAVAPTPGWDETNSANGNALGTITFYNAAGTKITGGLLSADPPWKYAAASTTRNGVNTVATMYYGLPDNSKANTLQWTASAAVGSSTYPTVSPAPASINALTTPVSTAVSGDADIRAYLQGVTLGSATGYANLIQVRLKDSGNNTSNSFWQAALEVNPTGSALASGLAAGEWRVVGAATPTNITPTVATPTAVPTSPQNQGTSVVFSTSVTGVAAGTVKFFDGVTQIGADKTVTSSGGTVSSDATTTLSRSGAYTDHSIVAKYYPPTYAAVDQVNSSALTFRVTANPQATVTNVALGSGTVQQPDAVTATATVTQNSTPVTEGSVTFKDENSNVLGTDAASPFTLSYSSSNFSVGTGHTITAFFTPTDANSYNASSSSPAALTVTASAYDPNVDNISTSIAPGTIVITTQYTGGNTLTLPAMTLDANATFYSTTANFAGIQVADTRAGNLPWTLSALASNLTKSGVASPDATQTINGQNVGLTTITKTSSNVTPNTFLGSVASGGSTSGQNLTAFNNAAASYVAAGDSGSLGLGGSSPHPVVHANNGLGTSVFAGTLTIQAPTNTVSGTYTGTVTFTVLGS